MVWLYAAEQTHQALPVKNLTRKTAAYSSQHKGRISPEMQAAALRGVAQLVRVPALGAGGRWFESSHPDKP